MNPWLYSSIISIIVFLVLCDWNSFIRNLWAGIICFLFQLGLHILVDKMDYWDYLSVNEGLPNWIVFSGSINIFFLIIAFTMGMLFIQFLPHNYYLQLIHACVWTFFYRLLFHIVEQNNMIHFHHWKVWMFYYAIPVHMLSLAMLKNTFFQKGEKSKNEVIE
jgi:hypothetical protein